MSKDNNTVDSIIREAVKYASSLQHEYVCIEHITLCLLNHEDIIKFCKKNKIDVETIQKDIANYLNDNDSHGLYTPHRKEKPPRTGSVERVFQRGLTHVIFTNKKEFTPLDLLASVLCEEECFARYYCEVNGLTRDLVQEYMTESVTTKEASKMIDDFTTNLNKEAEKSRIDPLIGRHEEVSDLIHILARRKKNNCILVGEPGTGKAQPLDSKIKTPDGWSTMAEIQVGDDIVAADGSVSKVTGCYPQGSKDIYRLVFKDGRSAESCLEHLWTVYGNFGESYKTPGGSSRRRLAWKTLTLKEIMELPKSKLRSIKFPLHTDAVPDQSLPMDPWLLGFLLGDGSFAPTKTGTFTTADPEIPAMVSERLIAGYEVKSITNSNNIGYKIVMERQGKGGIAGHKHQKDNYAHYYRKVIHDLGLLGTRSHEKFIPAVFKQAGTQQKIDLIAGLVDSDGHVERTGSLSITTVSDRLATDIQEMVRSIGGIAKIFCKKDRTYKYQNVETPCKDSYTIRIRFPQPNLLTKLPRKKQLLPGENYQYADLKLGLDRIEFSRTAEAKCIMIDHPDHLYITDNYVVTHNTAIAEGLAKKIVDGDVPSVLKNKTIYSIDIGAMLAGTKYRGDFEERMKGVLKFLENDDNAIIFIDEIHMIMGAGASGQGNIDAANLLKPVLGRGRLLTIGATTPDEFANTIEKDGAMMRRFGKLDIHETDVESTKAIVHGLKHYYEQFHGVEYDVALLNRAVDLTDRYVKTKHFPDKALDVIDAAGAATKLREEKTVLLDDVVRVISKISKIGTDVIDVESTHGYETLEARIKSRVFGQDEAIEKLIESILVSKAGLREPHKPIGSFLFVGPTGTGKAQPLYSKIKTPTGWTTFADVKPGDLVSTPDGATASVKNIYNRGQRPVYTVKFSDGRSVECCEDHLWLVYNKHWRKKWQVKSLKDILGMKSLNTSGIYIPLISDDNSTEEKTFDIDPYTIGAILGDGHFGEAMSFTTLDQEIYDRINETLLENYVLMPDGDMTYYTKYTGKKTKGTKGQYQPYRKIATQLGLYGKKSYNKFIPKEYMAGSKSQRIALIQGLLDTDGTADKKTGSISYTTVSPQLATDFADLIRSIGGIAKITHSENRTYVHNGDRKPCRDSYTVSVRYHAPRDLFSLERKKKLTKENYQYSDLKLKISDIIYKGVEEVKCIEIDHPDHLYITDNYVVTHNTETAKTLAHELDCKLVKFDMSEYQERHSVSKLIGAPPGYVGHAEGKMGQGQLLAAVEESPNCVLLLDEVEKADIAVLQVLLQIMEDGVLTGSAGKQVDFSNVILLMTSNLGAADSERRSIGFLESDNSNTMSEAVEKFFSPEFRNRIDAVVRFGKLQQDQMYMIVDKLVDETNTLLGSNDSSVRIALSDAAREHLSKEGYDPVMGARPLKRLFEQEIKKPLSKKVLFENIEKTKIIIDWNESDGYKFTY